MTNNSTWPSPDTQFNGQGRQDVGETYILSPTTNKAIDPTNVTITASVDPSNAAGIVALVSPPAQTNAGSNTVLTFASQINQLKMQNNGPANVYYDYDTPATLGSRVLAPGYFLADPKKLTTLNLYTVAAQNINGTTVGGIVVIGEL